MLLPGHFVGVVVVSQQHGLIFCGAHQANKADAISAI